MSKNIDLRDNEKKYIEAHSKILTEIPDEFWKNKICNLLKREIRKADDETVQFLINNPFTEFILYNDCFVFGYSETLKKLICLNDFIIIHEIESYEVSSALKVIFELYQEYGCINGTYKALLSHGY